MRITNLKKQTVCHFLRVAVFVVFVKRVTFSKDDGVFCNNMRVFLKINRFKKSEVYTKKTSTLHKYK